MGTVTMLLLVRTLSQEPTEKRSRMLHTTHWQGANILVDDRGTVKLADFGASRKVAALSTSVTSTATGVGGVVHRVCGGMGRRETIPLSHSPSPVTTFFFPLYIGLIP